RKRPRPASAPTPTPTWPGLAWPGLAWRLGRKNVHIAFSNFAEAFYRMMSEPTQHQVSVPEFNNLLVQNHILASQITAVVPILVGLPHTPPAVQQALDAMMDLLDPARKPPAALPAQFDTEGEQAALAYPLKQMLRACVMIRQELAGVADPEDPRPAPASA
ncbi:FUSC family protein, partial [Bordetella pertussis]